MCIKRNINEEAAFSLEFSRDDRNISPKGGVINGGITEADTLNTALAPVLSFQIGILEFPCTLHVIFESRNSSENV